MAHPKPDFTVKWATDNEPLTPIADVDQNAGWGYLGATPPTADEFDYMFNLFENRDKWLEERVTNSPSETDTAMVEIATQAETNAGTDDARVVTPKKLRFGFSANLAQRGYITFPSWLGGLIIQWGRDNGNGTDVTTFNFPLAFPTEVFTMVATDLKGTALSNGEAADSPVIHIKSLTQFESVLEAATTNPNLFGWVAIGK